MRAILCDVIKAASSDLLLEFAFQVFGKNDPNYIKYQDFLANCSVKESYD